MDEYRDIYPWAHDWSRDVGEIPTQELAVLEFLTEDIEKWTYDNHWSSDLAGGDVDQALLVDLYWTDDGRERLQLPPDIGDAVATFLVATIPTKIRLMIWHGSYWTQGGGWQAYTGPQGDFVDHIHLEFWGS